MQHPAMDCGTGRNSGIRKTDHLQRLTRGSKNAPRANLDTTQRWARRLEKNGLGAKISTQRLPRGLSENGPSPNPDTTQRPPPLSSLLPINIVHPSKGRRGSYLKVICRYLSCGPYAQGNPEGVWRGTKMAEAQNCTPEVRLEG